MDPHTAWTLAHDASADPTERADAAAGLADWCERGGYLPRAAAGRLARRTIISECRAIEAAMLAAIDEDADR